MSNDLNLAIGDLGDDNGVAELTNATVDLDLLVQELLEGRDVEDLVVNGLRGVDDELKPGKQVSSCALRFVNASRSAKICVCLPSWSSCWTCQSSSKCIKP